MSKKSIGLKSMLRASTAVLGLATACLMTAPASAVVINDNYTPTDVVDTSNTYSNVGQMVIDLQNGYIGLCTASLINPRTVIFAAHCVNETADGSGFTDQSSYGVKFGGMPIAFFFNSYNRTAIREWLGYGSGEAYTTNAALNAYNSNYVVYDTDSTVFGLGWNFLQADIALAALDTPVTDLPTWSLLLSPLTEATHATIVGYGVNGTGTTGASGGIDYRRRVAENTISVLGSLDDQDTFLFGSPDGLPANLYMLDFNDPKFNTADANWYDFNIFHDAALTLEGITASGDSGGPLIVDQLFDQAVIAAVLSGGDRFWSGQPSSSYGTTSFYQPLYLYWDWIVTNNPYKYVSAKSGDGLWTDPSHWVINLDPNYVTYVDGSLVNALPTEAAQGAATGDSVNTPKFGYVCYFDICEDISTGEIVDYSSLNITSTTSVTQLGSGVASTATQETITSLFADYTESETEAAVANAQAYSAALKSILQAQSSGFSSAEGSAEVNGVSIQGAPGSSNFVPNDTDGDPTTDTPARYYDVTLSADGTTTLTDATIIIDRLTVFGANTGLNITSTGALGTMIDTTIYAGTVNVDGVLASVGDIGLMGGVLTGNGVIATPYLTSVLGTIAPGGVGSIGTLTVEGNVILSSGSSLLIDVGSASNDLLDVYGTLSLGGTLVVTPNGSYVPKYKGSVMVAAADYIEGSFDSVADTIPGVLYPTVTTVTIGTGVDAYQVELVTFEAATFASMLGSHASADQLSAAALLDSARDAHYDDMAELYDAIDPLTGDTLTQSLEHLAPETARALPQIAALLTANSTSYLWDYLGSLPQGNEGKVAIQTSDLKVADTSYMGSVEMRSLLSALGSRDANPVPGAAVTPMPASSVGGMEMPKGMGAFLTGHSLDGWVQVGGGGGKATTDGFLISVGTDVPFNQHFRGGLAFTYGEVDAKFSSVEAHSKTTMKEVVFYGQYMNDSGLFANGFAGGAFLASSSTRMATVGGTSFTLKGHQNGSVGIFGLQVGGIIDDVLYGQARPAWGVQVADPTLNPFSETGGPAAMSVAEYNAREIDMRLGVDMNWSFDLGEVVLKPTAHLFYVANVGGTPANTMYAGFAAAPSTTAGFAVTQTSGEWAEFGLGLDAEVCDNALVGFHFNATPGRADANYKSFGGTVRIKF